ncbi:MAG: AAA family ATPase [Clostridia bacterium]|nr:AAA family ATPase [Clostridia bacterium]
MKDNSLVVNFFGGPGSGKSTAAAALFAELKIRQISCELVTEFAKDLTWEDNRLALTVQPYVFGNQYYRMVRCAGKVDVIITDSPLLLPIIHNTDARCGPQFNAMAEAAYCSFNNLSFFLERPELYESSGRRETEEEVERLAKDILHLAEKHNDAIIMVPCDAERNPLILSCVLERMRQEGVIGPDGPGDEDGRN